MIDVFENEGFESGGDDEEDDDELFVASDTIINAGT